MRQAVVKDEGDGEVFAQIVGEMHRVSHKEDYRTEQYKHKRRADAGGYRIESDTLAAMSILVRHGH